MVNSSFARYGLAVAGCLVLAFQAGASRMLKIDEAKIGVPGLHAIPLQLGQWNAPGEQFMDPDVTAYLRPDEYILRDYSDAQDHASLNLFVAYFKSLQSKYGPHSPRICLPGSGWLVSSSKVISIAVPGRPTPIPANQFIMEKDRQHILVLYWYQNDRDVWAEEFHAKLRLLPDLLRYRRSDVSLVRLVAPMDSSDPSAVLSNSLQFASGLLPLLMTHFASVSSGA
jgi:EpsI family protein